MSNQSNRFKLIVWFFSGITVLFGIQVYFVRTDRQLQAEVSANQVIINRGCMRHESCPGITNLCLEDGNCQEIENPICVCSQPMVVRCTDRYNTKLAKHTFCQQGCRVINGSAQCL